MKRERILIFNPFGIGDVLFTSPLIANLRSVFPAAHLAYLCNRRTQPILTNNSLIGRVHVFEKDEWRKIKRQSKLKFAKHVLGFFGELKREKFDLVFDLSLNSQYGAFLKMAGIKNRIGYNFKKRGRFLTDSFDLPDGYRHKHMVEYYLSLLALIKVKPGNCRMEYFLATQDIEFSKMIMEKYHFGEKPLVGIIPGGGASWARDAFKKRWPADKFASLAKKIIYGLRADVVIFGSRDEYDLCSHIESELNFKVINLCGKITLNQFAALCARCKLIVTNDGGPLHVAVALEIPTVSLFGPVDEKVYGPYPLSDKHIVVKEDLKCRPCYQCFRLPPCEHEYKCIQGIDVERVFSSCQKLLHPPSLQNNI